MKSQPGSYLVEIMKAWCGLVLISQIIGCDQRPVDAFCEDWLAKRQANQEKARVSREAEEARMDADIAEAIEPREFTSTWQAIGFTEFNLNLRWRDGQLLYKVSAIPPRPKKITEALSRVWTQGAQGPGFQITLLDDQGFQTHTFFLSLWNMAPDGTGKRLEGIGSEPCSAKEYMKTSSWTARTVHF